MIEVLLILGAFFQCHRSPSTYWSL